MGKRMCEAPWESVYCLGEMEAAMLRAFILPPHRTHCFLSIILEHRVLGQQFCPQDVCLQALPSKSQSSRLPLTIQTPKWKRGENPWAVLLMPNKVYLYSKIATGYLSLQKLKRLGSLNFKILSLWEVEAQVSENGHQRHVLTAPSVYFTVNFHKWSTPVFMGTLACSECKCLITKPHSKRIGKTHVHNNSRYSTKVVG